MNSNVYILRIFKIVNYYFMKKASNNYNLLPTKVLTLIVDANLNGVSFLR